MLIFLAIVDNEINTKVWIMWFFGILLLFAILNWVRDSIKYEKEISDDTESELKRQNENSAVIQ